MEDEKKKFSIRMYNRLKNTINAGIKCDVKEDDILEIEINRLGLIYRTTVKDISVIISKGDSEEELAFDKVVKRYRSFVNHKFFY